MPLPQRILRKGLPLVILLLTSCDQSVRPGRSDISCETTDPRMQVNADQIKQLEMEGEDEAYAEEYWTLLQEREIFLSLFPLRKADGWCTLQPEIWTIPCGTAQFRVPMHPRLQCQPIANGVALLSPASQELERPEREIVRIERVNQPWNSENRVVENVGEETVGHVPVKVQVQVQKDPLPEDCDPNDPCAWEWKWQTAPFHYEIRGETLFHDIVDFVTKQLVCLDSNERCPPTVPFIP